MVVLYGGQTTINQYQGVSAYNGYLGDTHQFDGTKWTIISNGASSNSNVLTSPLPRARASMAYDGTYLTMVGGTNSAETLNSVWSYSPTKGWFQIPETVLVNQPNTNFIFTTPYGVVDAQMNYVSGLSSALLFGGSYYAGSAYVPFGFTTWQYQTLGTWIPLPTNWPPARSCFAMASNATTTVLYGGKSNASLPLSDTWVYQNGGWSQFTDTLLPPLYGASMVWDASASAFILFGGVNAFGNYSNQTFSFTTASGWQNRAPSNSPPPRAFANFCYLTATSQCLLGFGIGALNAYNDLWSFSYPSGWTQL